MTDQDGVNMDAEMQIDSTLIKLAEQYAGCDRRSAEINDERATIRANAEKLGIPSKSFQHAVGMVKHMSEGERRDYQVGVNRVLKAISDRQNELFPVEAEKARKRDEARKPSGKEGAPDPDTNPRSNPKAGGAGKAGKAAKPEEQAPNPPGEQDEGEQVLSRAPTNANATERAWPDDKATTPNPRPEIVSS